MEEYVVYVDVSRIRNRVNQYRKTFKMIVTAEDIVLASEKALEIAKQKYHGFLHAVSMIWPK